MEEEREIKPHLIFTITDSEGDFVRRITTLATKGVNKITWDLRYQSLSPTKVKDGKFNPVAKSGNSFPVIPGKYFVSMDLFANGKISNLVGQTEFKTETLNNTTLPAKNKSELEEFQRKTIHLARVIWGTQKYAEELQNHLEILKQTIYKTPTNSLKLFTEVSYLSEKVDSILFVFRGEKPKASEEEIPPATVSLNSRLGTLMYTHWKSTSNITQNQKTAYQILINRIPDIQKELLEISTIKIKSIEDEMEKNNAPWTPGRMPKLK
jgi:hypothetical protein